MGNRELKSGERKHRLVYIEWVDSNGCASVWSEVELPLKAEPMVCHSVGWLLQDDAKCKVVVPHMTKSTNVHEQGCGDMTIPTKAVLKIIDLKVKE